MRHIIVQKLVKSETSDSTVIGKIAVCQVSNLSFAHCPAQDLCTTVHFLSLSVQCLSVSFKGLWFTSC